MGRMIVRVRNNPEGRRLVAGWMEMGGPPGLRDHLFAFLGRAGVTRGSSYDAEAADLGGTHHLFEVPDGQEILWMNEMFLSHNVLPVTRNLPNPNPIEYIDADSLLYLSSMSLQGPVGFKQTHADYLKLLNVTAAHQNNFTGSKRIIAILDTGIDPYQEMSPGQLISFLMFYDLDSSAGGLAQTAPVTTTPTDSNGHGTAMAAVIQSVAPGAILMIIRVCDSTSARLWQVLAGLYTAVFQCRAEIVNLSLGFNLSKGTCSSCGGTAQARSIVLENFMNGFGRGLSQSAGTPQEPVFVAAAGNDGQSELEYPAALPNVIAVGSINLNGNLSGFSHYPAGGHSHFLVGPGGDGQPKGSLTEYPLEVKGNAAGGTSVSAAYITGVTALLWDKYWPDYTKSPHSSDKFMDWLNAKCDKTYQGNNRGHGLLDYS